MSMTSYATDERPTTSVFWSLSDTQLERVCRLIAEGQVAAARPFVRAEAMRLFLLWRDIGSDTEQMPTDEDRASVLAALRKRTIQVLVRIRLTAAPRPQYSNVSD